MSQVKEEKIKNTTIRKQFNNIQEVSFYIKRCTWNYIGKIIRASENLLPRQLTGAWTLKEIIPESVDDQGKFKDFFVLAKNETLWESKLQEYENRIINSTRDDKQDERNDNGRDNNDEEEDDDPIFSKLNHLADSRTFSLSLDLISLLGDRDRVSKINNIGATGGNLKSEYSGK